MGAFSLPPINLSVPSLTEPVGLTSAAGSQVGQPTQDHGSLFGVSGLEHAITSPSDYFKSLTGAATGTGKSIVDWWKGTPVSNLIVLIIGIILIGMGLLTFAFGEIDFAGNAKQAIRTGAEAAIA